MAYIIQVTLTGGAKFGPENDTKISINAYKIIKVVNIPIENIGTSKIIMDDKSEYNVNETQTEIAKLAN